jgi:hypothetical protein
MLEGAATWRAIDAWLPIEFRADVDPRAVLQIKMVTLAKPKWLEPTSPGHAYEDLRLRLRQPDPVEPTFGARNGAQCRCSPTAPAVG